MSYRGVDEVRQALMTGLVASTDQIRLSETEPWRPVSEVVGMRTRLQWKEHFHWYVLIVMLVGMHLAGVSLIGLLGTLCTHVMWRNTERRGPRGGPRWW